MTSTTQPGARIGVLKFQANHGFRRGQPVVSSGGVYKLATEATGFDGVVGTVSSAGQFELVTGGQLDNIAGVLATGQALYLSSKAGVLASSGKTLVLKGQSSSVAIVQAPQVGVVATAATATSATGFTSAGSTGSGKAVLNAPATTAAKLKVKSLTGSGQVTVTDNGDSLDVNVPIPAPAPPAGIDIQAAYDALILAEPSLVSFWKCNEAIGATSLADSKGSNPLALSGSYILGRPGPMPGTGMGGVCFATAGTGVATAATNTGIPTGSNPVTMELWMASHDVYAGSNNVAPIYFGATAINAGLFLMYVNGAYILAYGNGTQATAGELHATDGQWHHIVITCDGAATYNIYYDGLLAGTTGAGATPSFGTTPPSLGGTFGPLTPYNGLISRAAIYAGVLTAAQVKKHYNTGKLGFAP